MLVPLTSTDVPFVFNEVTADFQDATIQGELTYRITDAKRVAEVLDYSVDARRKYRSDDPTKIGDRLVNSAQILARSFTQKRPLAEVLVSSDLLVAETLAGLQQSPTVQMLGLVKIKLAVGAGWIEFTVLIMKLVQPVIPEAAISFTLCGPKFEYV